jgi:hypothetical protein
MNQLAAYVLASSTAPALRGAYSHVTVRVFYLCNIRVSFIIVLYCIVSYRGTMYWLVGVQEKNQVLVDYCQT